MRRRVITVLEAMKTFLNSEDHDMLACAVEGFTKLLFLNRLPIYQIDVLSHLFLLYFNNVTERNEHIRQCLSMFFPLYASNKTSACEGNRKTVANCLMPCLRAVAYAPRDSALNTVPINKLTEYFLWLLDADPLTNPDAKDQVVESTDTISFHEQIAFDVLFEIEANLESTGIRNLCRVLSLLNLSPKNGHNIKQYKVLLNRISSKVTDKMGAKYLAKFRVNLDTQDEKPEEDLDEEALQKLEERRAEKVETAVKELETWIQEQNEEDGAAESPIPQTGVKRRKMGKRHGELESGDEENIIFGSPDENNKRRKESLCPSGNVKPTKKKRTKSPRNKRCLKLDEGDEESKQGTVNEEEFQSILKSDDEEDQKTNAQVKPPADCDDEIEDMINQDVESSLKNEKELEKLLEDSD